MAISYVTLLAGVAALVPGQICVVVVAPMVRFCSQLHLEDLMADAFQPVRMELIIIPETTLAFCVATIV